MNIRTLDFSEAAWLGKFGPGNKWYPFGGTPAAEYIEENGYRSPSHRYPHTYIKPLLTQKFAKWAVQNHSRWAVQVGILEI